MRFIALAASSRSLASRHRWQPPQRYPLTVARPWGLFTPFPANPCVRYSTYIKVPANPCANLSPPHRAVNTDARLEKIVSVQFSRRWAGIFAPILTFPHQGVRDFNHPKGNATAPLEKIVSVQFSRRRASIFAPILTFPQRGKGLALSPQSAPTCVKVILKLHEWATPRLIRRQ